MVVEVEPSCRELCCLARGQHTEGDAALHAKTFHGPDHVADLIKIALLWTTPSRSQAEASCTRILGAFCCG